jgi:hypothetical protein
MLPSTRKLAEHIAIPVKADVTSLTTLPIAHQSSAEGFQVVNKTGIKFAQVIVYRVRPCSGRKTAGASVRRPYSRCAYRLEVETGCQWRGCRTVTDRLSVAIHSKIARSASSNPDGRSGRLARWAVKLIGERATTATIVDKRGLDSSKNNTTPYSLND